MELLHEPEACMYPHCVFRVWVNDELITYNNYENTVKKLSYIKLQLKEELAYMIIKREVSQIDIP